MDGCGVACIQLTGKVAVVNEELTYWLIRTMAMSSRSVKFLNASSIACVGVSSAIGHVHVFAQRVGRIELLIYIDAFVEHFRSRVEIVHSTVWRQREGRTWIDNKVIGTVLWTVIADASKQEASGGVLVANDGDEVAAFSRLDDSF